ncbi:ThuA domain-containing protein [Candidatus Latescibacterota bacterium]
MALFTRQRRRRFINTGIASLAAAVAGTPEAESAPRPKAPGETRIVAMMAHDNLHNGVSQEVSIRNVFKSKNDWRIIFVRGSKFFTPDLISDADLLITARTGIADPIDLYPDAVSDTAEPGARLWTDENVKAIIDNVKNRGMGFLALHNTIYSRSREIVDLLGVKEIMHNEVQPIWVRDLNQNHPITKGIGKFFINLDEQFAVVIKSKYTETLFETTAIHDKRRAIGGWCLESGKGRIVGLLPGHTAWPYQVREYCDILWRSAHWAMRWDIPPYEG